MSEQNDILPAAARPIPHFPFYMVETDGTVWACRARGGRQVPWFKMTLVPMPPDGRYIVGLRRNGKLYVHYVHRIVLMTFVGPCPAGLEGCHNNGNPTDNRIENLRWDTHTANMADRTRHGKDLVGEKNPAAKLSSEQVAEIRQRYRDGEQQKDLAPKYGVSKSLIGAICRGEIWNGIAASKRRKTVVA